ncbi:hypothetical protein AKJ52_00080 [candidate division MSBL1 archaeon SCGC-AAA382C18]|uniref:Transposase IS701-like DDE domain-containing protein n=1 Tax=candidate division MSBL1 archaeon SCGC-AAA382C18 TaxID=1698281 RepID=A0A133VM57_9EURY|nr:hypothetical protein AKJ52_00080 [candidate division MSBL1 archaeon SCGC-AAA382C18]
METFVSKIDLEDPPGRFEAFHERFSELFKTKTRNVGDKAMDYLLGGLHLDKKFVLTNIPEVVDDTNNQRLHHFISESPWRKEPVIERLQEDASELIGGEDTALVVDGVSFPKQGEKSVGVARQWCGRLGKVENCQVGVFLGLATPDGERTLIDERLYLPEDWIEDEERREEAGVPEDVEFKTKPELALDMILEAKENGVSFGWVNADTAFGDSGDFRRGLDEEDITYVVEVPCNTNIWLEEEVDPSGGKRKPSRRVDELADELDQSQFEEVYVRDTERGELRCDAIALRVRTVENDCPSDDEEWLVIRKDNDETKYLLSNAPPNAELEKLVRMSAGRYWIERAIEDGKGEVGMADYEVRKWRGWHHHMTMTMLAMLLLLEMKIGLGDKCPDLTVQDVRDILQRTLPKRNVTKDDFRKLLEEKIKRRKSAKKSRHRKNKNS